MASEGLETPGGSLGDGWLVTSWMEEGEQKRKGVRCRRVTLVVWGQGYRGTLVMEVEDGAETAEGTAAEGPRRAWGPAELGTVPRLQWTCRPSRKGEEDEEVGSA